MVEGLAMSDQNDDFDDDADEVDGEDGLFPADPVLPLTPVAERALALIREGMASASLAWDRHKHYKHPPVYVLLLKAGKVFVSCAGDTYRFCMFSKHGDLITEAGGLSRAAAPLLAEVFDSVHEQVAGDGKVVAIMQELEHRVGLPHRPRGR